MRLGRLFPVVFVVGLLVSGCGDVTGDAGAGADAGLDDVGAGDGGDETPTWVDPQQAAAALAALTCDRVLECFGPLGGGAVGTPDCEAHLTTLLLEGEFAQVVRATGAGTVVYDGAEMAACLEALGQATCTELLQADFKTPCDQALVGQVAPGGACQADVECAGAARCDAYATCPGVCVALSPAGGPCDWAGDCAEGVCLRGACGQPQANGAACESGADCASTFCDIDVCVPAPPVGSPCEHEGQCADAMVCLNRGGTATCQDIPSLFTGELGEACNFPFGCEVGLVCEASSFEASTGTFVAACAVPSAEADGPCLYAFPDACPAGYRCEVDFPASTEGTCLPLPADGELCPEDLCAPGYVCDPYSYCRAWKRRGESCSGDEVCYSGACEGGVCVLPLCEASGLE